MLPPSFCLCRCAIIRGMVAFAKESEMERVIDICRTQVYKEAFKRAMRDMDNRIDNERLLVKAVKALPKILRFQGHDMALEAVFDQTEYFWLVDQYGSDEFLDDEDFMHFYRKHREQVELERTIITT